MAQLYVTNTCKPVQHAIGVEHSLSVIRGATAETSLRTALGAMKTMFRSRLGVVNMVSFKNHFGNR